MAIKDNTLQHPWLQRLLQDGPAAIEEVLHGTAALGHLGAAEPEDALDALLSPESHEGRLWQAFDSACLELLKKFRKRIFTLQEPDYTVSLMRTNSLLSIVRRLLPETTVTNFHDDKARWTGLFENFVLDRSFDMRREFYRILALSQDIAARHTSSSRQTRYLMPFWLSLCSESGEKGIYDKSYLRIGLMGLRALPLGKEFSANEHFVLQGLARWAAFCRPKKEEFLREWHLLKGDFPRTDAFWLPLVEAVIASLSKEISLLTSGKCSTFSAAAWWLKTLPKNTGEKKQRKNKALTPPLPDPMDKIINSLHAKFDNLRPQIDRLLAEHQDYAEGTGDVFYLVRTAVNIGQKLIKSGPPVENSERGEYAAELANMVLHYEPDNPFAWSLWRDALAAAKRLNDAELVGWEAVRLFPEDIYFRNQLANLLAGQLERPEEAEKLLLQTIELFPQDVFARTQLATHLAERLAKPEEAESLLRQSIELFPQNVVARNQLAKLLAGQLERPEEAEGLLRQTIDLFPQDLVARRLLATLLAGRLAKPEEEEKILQEVIAPSPLEADCTTRLAGQSQISPKDASLYLPNAEARRLLFRFEANKVTTQEIKEFLERHERNAYLDYLAAMADIESNSGESSFLIALAKALSTKDSLTAVSQLAAPSAPLEESLLAAGQGLDSEQDLSVEPLGASVFTLMPRIEMLDEALSRKEHESDTAAWKGRRRILLRDFTASLLSRAAPLLSRAA